MPQKGRGPEPRQHKDWTVLFYLCGDNDANSGELARATARDLREISRAGSSPHLHVAVQRDGPDGCERYVMPERGLRARALIAEANLGRVNSGNPDTLASFLQWGFERCPSTYVALVLSGTGILDPRSVVGLQQIDPDRVFAICDDSSARDALEISELGRVLDDACLARPEGYRQIDLLAFDMGQAQFLEVACELQGRVGVLIGPQCPVNADGWDNTQLLRGWHRWLARERAPQTKRRSPDPVAALARVTVESAGASYVAALPRGTRVEVAALDLRRLERLIGPFEAMAVAYLQHLSDRLAWDARRDAMKRAEVKPFIHEYSYDMRAICQAVSNQLAVAGSRRAVERSLGLLGKLDPLKLVQALEAIEMTASEMVVHERDVGTRELDPDAAGEDDPRLQDLQAVHAWLQQSLQRAWDVVRTPRRAARNGDTKRKQAIRDVLAGFPFTRDEARVATWMTVLARAIPKLAPEVAGFVGTAIREKQHADRLRRLTAQVVTALDPVRDDDGDEVRERKVVLHLFRSASEHGGLSLYRPKDLSELTRRSYLALRVNRRLHWTALLTAIHLLEDQPEALWGVFSSLLATAGPGGRDELIVRMAGPQSATRVEQFNALGPAPAVVLSLEQETSTNGMNGGDADSDSDGDAGAGAGVGAGNVARRAFGPQPQTYRVRLTSSRRDAAIFEQQSRVNPKTIDAVLRGIETLLSSPMLTVDQARDAQSLGSLLGEDIVRDLTDRLEDERQREGGNLHLLLQIPQSLMRYPWELIRDRHGWLSERFAMGRQVYLQMGSARWRTRRSADRLRALIIGDPLLEPAANAPQLGGAALEAEQVAQVFERLADETGDLIDFDRARDLHINQTTTIVDVRSWLRGGEYDIIHFAGHARFVPSKPECSAWLLSDGELWASEIRNTLAMCDAPPWLVYANACEAAMEADGSTVHYQQDVFGLATAFITQGVTAYVAPLWPLDDRVAMLAATDFYRTLVLDRSSLGESLRTAKRDARARLPGIDVTGQEAVAPVNPQQQLSWASLVLYGDATATLMQRLGSLLEGGRPSLDGSGAATSVSAGDDRWSSPGAGAGAGAGGIAFASADIDSGIGVDRDRAIGATRFGIVKTSIGLESGIVRRGDLLLPTALPTDLPNVLPFPDGDMTSTPPARIDTPAPSRSVAFDVIEQAGLRYWRLVDDRGRARALPGSSFMRFVDAEQTRLRVQRGIAGSPRVLARWLVSLSPDPSIRDLARQHDAHITPNESVLLMADGGASNGGAEANEPRPLDEDGRVALDRALASSGGRVLLLLHDTCGRACDLAATLDRTLLRDARQHYAAIIGYDHWTLSKSPKDNAADLWLRLPRAVRQGR